MLRLTEVKLPLDHAPEAVRAAALKRLKIDDAALLDCVVFRRGYDARKRADIHLVYTLDVEVRNEAAVLKKMRGDPKITITPDTSYHFIAKAPAVLPSRPVVIGLGPCGLFAALTLAQMGFKPIVLERGKAVRECTQGNWGLWRKSGLKPGSDVTVLRRRPTTVFHGKPMTPS